MSRIRPRAGWLVPVLLALALVGTACGDGGNEGGTGTAGGAGGGAGAEAPEHPEGSTMAEIQAAGTMTVGTKFDQPLFGLKRATTGEIEGFDVEIARLIAEAIGPDVEVEFVETPSAVREQALENGDVDMVVATYTINDARKQRVGFAGPYYVAGQDIMVPAGNPLGIEGVEDLNGKRVCSVAGSTSIENVREMAPEAEVTEFDVYSKCADAMGDGRVDAVSTDNVILLGLVEASDGEFELVGNPFTSEPYGIGVAKDDTEFRAFINDTLEELYQSGEWAEAYERTVGKVDDEVPEPPEIDRY
ncbi:MAG: glutamate ABC transporter substrate-binding protein [Actinomycetota bacterium]|jgi:glutamate transport system substrate-binding protein|nr:glutamate ABC transporter substrate-binding protein [Actinomycetota bacterium]